jgi:hypothetical protein
MKGLLPGKADVLLRHPETSNVIRRPLLENAASGLAARLPAITTTQTLCRCESRTGAYSQHRLLAEHSINWDLQQFGKHQLPSVRISPPMPAQVSTLVRNGDKMQSHTLRHKPPTAHTYPPQMEAAADNRCRPNGIMFSEPLCKCTNLAQRSEST